MKRELRAAAAGLDWQLLAEETRNWFQMGLQLLGGGERLRLLGKAR